MWSCYYTSGCSWPSLLLGHNTGLCPACHLLLPPDPSQQRWLPDSQGPAFVIIPEIFQYCENMQSSSSSCLFPRLHAIVCIHLEWVSFHLLLSFFCSYSYQHASLVVHPCLPRSHLTVGCSISPWCYWFRAFLNRLATMLLTKTLLSHFVSWISSLLSNLLSSAILCSQKENPCQPR